MSILLKADMIQFTLRFAIYLSNSEKNLNHRQYGLTQIIHLEEFSQSLLSKAHMVRFALSIAEILSICYNRI